MLNKYTFRETEFTTQENVYLIQDAFYPLQKFLSKVTEMFTAELELDSYNVYRKRYNELEFKERRDQEDLKNLLSQDEKNHELIERVENAIKKNVELREQINNELANDEKANEQLKLYNEACSDAYIKTLRQYELVKSFLEVYLIGDKSKLDYTDPAMLDFTDKVITDFFLSQAKKLLR